MIMAHSPTSQDGDGLISSSDLKNLLESQGCPMWPGAPEEMIREAGVSHPGFVTFDEFIVISYG